MFMRKKKYDKKVTELIRANARVASMELAINQLEGQLEGMRQTIKLAGLRMHIVPDEDRGLTMYRAVVEQTINMRMLVDASDHDREHMIKHMVADISCNVAHEMV